MADPVPTESRTLNIREARAGARAAVGHEGADMLRGTRITNPAEGAVVTRATERLRENNWRKALETIGSEEPADANWGGWEDIVPGQVFTDVDPATGERVARGGAGSPEAARQTRINTAMRAYDGLLQNGYNALTAPQRTEVDRIVRNTVQGSLQLRDLYTDATGNIIPARREQLLNDPILKKHLAAALNEVFDPAKRFPMADVQKAVEEYTKANTELTNLTSERTRLQRELGTATPPPPLTAQTLTDAGYDAGIHAGTETRGNATARIRGVLLGASTTIITGRGATERIRALQSFEQNLKDLADNSKLARTNTNIQAAQRLQDEINVARAETTIAPGTTPPRSYGALTSEFQNLLVGRQEVAQKRREAETRVRALDGEITTKTAEVNTKRAEQADKLRDARAHSTKFEQTVNRALAKAIKNTTGELVAAYLGGYVTAENESLALAKDENRQRISDELQRRLTRTTRRWINYLPGTGWLGNNHREVLNERQIRRDARTLLRRGPDALVEQVLRGANVPAAEREQLLRDPVFMQQQGKEMYGKVLAGHIMTGGKIAPSEYEALAMTDWGSQVLTEMISKNAQAVALVEQHTGQPYTEQSVRQLLANKDTQKWLRRALLTAGGLALFYAGPVGIATAAGAIGSAVNYVAGDAATQWVDAAKDLVGHPEMIDAGDGLGPQRVQVNNNIGKVVGRGVDAVAGAGIATGKAVVDNVVAVGHTSTALQGAGNAIATEVGKGVHAVQAGNVGDAIGHAAKSIVETAQSTGSTIATNIDHAKAAATRP